MPNNKSKKTPKPRDNNGRYVAPEKAVVSRIGINEENPVPKKSGKTELLDMAQQSLIVKQKNHYDIITSAG